MVQESGGPALCDYEGSPYQTEFWTPARIFEDRTERLALQKLLPAAGARLVEVGAGFGRLADLYGGYAQVILVEPALSLLQAAQQRWGHDERFVFVRGNVYGLPLADSAVDTVVMVRVLHHLVDVPRALGELRRVLSPAGSLVLEYANKRNAKAIARYALRRQPWSPYDAAPVEFVALNFDFHPAWVSQQLDRAGFAVQQELAVSHFRAPFFKRLLSPARLAALDGVLQKPGGRLKLAPSVFVRAGAASGAVPRPPVVDLWRCPRCGGGGLVQAGTGLACPSCAALWPQRDGIFDFGDMPAP